MSEISERKASHLSLCAEADVEGRQTTLLEEVKLFHEALPELAWHEIDLSVDLFGRRLEAPILISGMSGGAEIAAEFNRSLASTAQKFGLAMGVGSQRAMLTDPNAAASYRVREVAPDILLFANLGAVQARDAGLDAIEGLIRDIGADALCIHLNPAQELVQDEGDRDFRGCLDAIGELASELPLPVVIKETGCGFAPATLARLRSVGIHWVDVAGAGGTTWTGVEALRGSARQRALGETLREWGIPTAASLIFARRLRLRAVASGGIRDGADAVRALALGAELVGLALPFLRAYTSGGAGALAETASRLTESMRALMLLTGAQNVGVLRSIPRVLGASLRNWVDDGEGRRNTPETSRRRVSTSSPRRRSPTDRV